MSPAAMGISRVSGGQTRSLMNGRAVAAMPSGGAVVMSSVRTVTGGDERDVEVRLSRLTDRGVPEDRRCASFPDPEIPLKPTILGDGVLQYQSDGTAVMPGQVDGTGLLLFVESSLPPNRTAENSPGPGDLFAVFADATGCPSYGDSGEIAAFKVSDTIGVSRAIVSPIAIRLADGDFVAIWIEQPLSELAVANEVRVRRFRDLVLPQYVPSAVSPEGYSAALPLPERRIMAVDAVTAGDRIAVAWEAIQGNGTTLKLQLYTIDFEPVGPERVIGQETGTLPGELHRIRLGFDGATLLMTWVGSQGGSSPHVYKQWLSADADPLPDDGVPAVSDHLDQEQIEPDVLPLTGGGFLVAWTARASQAQQTQQPRSTRAVAFWPNRERRFAAPPCGESEFALPAAADDESWWPTLTEMASGDLLISWNSRPALQNTDVLCALMARQTVLPGPFHKEQSP
jgi:hypothetical protein